MKRPCSGRRWPSCAAAASWARWWASSASASCSAFLTPHFLTVSNLLNVMEQTSINAVIAVGMTFVILSGGIDLSVGSLRRALRRGAGQRRSRPDGRRRSPSR